MNILFNSRTPEYAWLSNFAPSPLVDKQGNEWPTVEHAYQACKTLDPREQEMIRVASSANAAKQLGKAVMVRADWQTVKVVAMERLLKLKFQDPELRSKLDATKPQQLIHLSPWDKYWGVDNRGKGENVLGKLLMQIRE